MLRCILVFACFGISSAVMAPGSTNHMMRDMKKTAASDIQEGIAEANKLLPQFRSSFAGKPEEEAAMGKATLEHGATQVSDGIQNLHKLAEELQSSLAEVQATEKAELEGLGELAKKTQNKELMKVKEHAEKTLGAARPKKQDAQLLLAKGTKESVVGQFEGADALIQQKAKTQTEEFDTYQKVSKVDKSAWITISNATIIAAWEKIFPSAPTVLQLAKKKLQEGKSNAEEKAQAEWMLSASRNTATRLFFRGVSRLPTAELKMSALENFLLETEKQTGKKVGGRLYVHELEHWLTTEYLASEINEKMGGLGFVMGNKLPDTLQSRDDNFKKQFHEHMACGKDWFAMMAKKKPHHTPKLMEYGSHCGLQDDIQATTACHADTTTQKVGHETVNVCKDSGLDRCCAQHDLGKTSTMVSPIFNMELCKADKELLSCAAKVTPSDFVDARGLSEKDAQGAITCLYSALPCLARTSLWKLDIDWTRSHDPVQLVKPTPSSNHHSIKFPWETEKDSVRSSEVYREQRADETNEPILYHIKSE